MNKNRFSLQTFTALTILLMAGSYFVGFSAGSESLNDTVPTNLSNPESGKESDVDFAPFWQVWNLLNEKFVAVATSTKPVTEQGKLWGAIEGLASSYGDPYTVFFPPVESQQFAEEISGNFEGVGMEVALRDGVVTVVAPLKGTPAYKAGVLAGDKIIKIDSTVTAGMTVEEAVKLIRGKKGTTVKISVSREGDKNPKEILIVRDIINIPTIDTELLKGGKVFVIHLYNFSAVSTELFRAALREFALSGTEKLILDVRGNPGGYLEAAVDMTSWFLPSGEVIVREDFGGKYEEVVHRSKGYDVFNENLKMVVLIDGGSASASEILAGALKDHNKAVLIGSKTFGKGSVQELVRVTSDTSLKVTIARWLTPNGYSISNGGLTPDLEVKRTSEDFEKDVDPQLDRAIRFLTEGN